ncbi:MAG: GGDEF domain-containing protein [Candidatus Omnitrophica bacterium]|nr:GGDEF domain-containing protein [Candidatus Omnitrophota bacterium]
MAWQARLIEMGGALWLRARERLTVVPARYHRRVLMACATTLGVSVVLLGLIAFTQWRGRQALRSDTRAIITQAGEQLLRSLQSRRGTLTLLRDTLRRAGTLSALEQHAMGSSAVAHTRHLLGIGLIRPGQSLVWWSAPSGLSHAELAELERATAARLRLRNSRRVPATFVVATAQKRQWLIMLEPLRRDPNTTGAMIGAFDLARLLEDFFTSGILQGYPVQLLDEQAVLYRSQDWMPQQPARPPVIVERPVALDAAQWTMQMQPGTSRVIQTLSWSNMLLVALSVIAGVGITVIVWILAARAWILQRVVARRTAALHRTLQRVRQLATTDELTGLYNRRFFLNRLAWECDRAKRYQRPLACLMVDVNGFKRVNDHFGHLAGDLILKQVARELRNALRQSDIIARFGGDEFVVALPETTSAQAQSVIDKLRQVAIPVPKTAPDGLPPVSLSVGVSRTIDPHDRPEDLLEDADQSLYASKQRLYNRISRHFGASTAS